MRKVSKLNIQDAGIFLRTDCRGEIIPLLIQEDSDSTHGACRLPANRNPSDSLKFIISPWTQNYARLGPAIAEVCL